MSRPKPYARDTKPRDTDSQWKHDLYANTRPSLAARLGGASTSASASASASASSSSRATAAPGASLLNRMSGGKGKELIVMAASGSKLFGFDGTNTNGNGKVKGNGRELLPASGKAARPGRASRQRGVESQLVSKSLGAALADRVGYSGSRSGSGSPGISIMGSAGVRVRVEHLAKGTTVSDLKSAFAPTKIVSARLVSTDRERTSTVEVDVEDVATAEQLVKQFHGVVADGETLRVTIVRSTGGGKGRRGGNGNGNRQNASRAGAQPTGKMYSDGLNVDTKPARAPAPKAAPAPQPAVSSLAARLGARR